MTLRARIRQGDRVIGTFVKTPSPHVVESLAVAGIDFVVADLEHAPIGWETLDVMALAGSAWGLPVLFRSRSHAISEIAPGLDLGCTGVMVPHVDSQAVREACVEAVRFGSGRRGFSPSVRAGRYGREGRDFLTRSDEETVLVAQIEDRQALSALHEISASSDVDVLFVGPADLSVSFELFRGTPLSDAELAEKVADISGVTRASGVAVGMFVSGPEEIERWSVLGVTVFVCGSDQAMLRAAGAALMNHFKERTQS